MLYSFVPFCPVSASLFVCCERFFVDLYRFCLVFCFLSQKNNILVRYNVFGPRGPSSVP